MTHVAIYARKSKLTHTGESIDNQIKCCKDYLSLHNPFKEPLTFSIYTDEGFSGKSINRPGFQNFLEDTKTTPFKLLICYRLDRVSRSVLDFTNTYDFLEKKGIQFISVSEQFDTSTPMGFAMLHITIVFAQLERQAIAARVRDNMLSLAASGRWLGGVCPTGFRSQPIEYLDSQFHKKKMYQLTPIPSELTLIKLIFDKFLEFKSLRGLETYLINTHMKTPNNKDYSPSTLKRILTNPVYAKADSALYHYLNQLNCMICNPAESFDGSCSVLAYNKHSQVGSRLLDNTYDKWIVALANHQGQIDGTSWVMVQNILNDTSHLSYHSSHPDKQGIFTSLIKCKQCGSTMRIKKGRISQKTGHPTYSYICRLKETSHKKKCAIPNLVGPTLDTYLLSEIADYLKALPDSQMILLHTLKSLLAAPDTTQSHDPTSVLLKKKKELEKSIKNVMANFEALPPTQDHLKTHFLTKLDTLSQELNLINQKLREIPPASTTTQSPPVDLSSLIDLKKLLLSSDIDTQRACMKLLIDTIDWDGEELNIHLNHKK